MKTVFSKRIIISSICLISAFFSYSQAYVNYSYHYQEKNILIFEGYLQDSVNGFDSSSWHWDFGDDRTYDTVIINNQGLGAVNCTISHEFIVEPNNYNVCLEVSTNLGNSGTQCNNIVISPCSGFEVQYSIVDDSCNVNNEDGSIELMVSGGTEPYAYQWENGGTLNIINNLPAGNYCFTVTDANNCTISDCIGIHHYSSVGINYIKKDVSSPISTDGQIELSAYGGESPYLYTWNTGFTNNQYIGLSSGLYSATVTDNNNCSASTQIAIISDYLSFNYDTCLYNGVDTSAYNIYQIEATDVPGLLSITWQIPGMDSLIFVDAEYLFEYAGLYSLELILNCQKSQSSLFDTIQITNEMLSINRIKLTQNNNLVNIYPNPANNNITISVNYFKNEPLKLHLYNSVGALVQEKTINAEIIDISALSKGMYVLTISSTENGIVFSKKIIIN
ncbi:MAG: T9SS type A sorting domain-containing protein [Salinivirgaceae bacterium]